MTLPDLPSGVYRHYKGPLYFVFGYGHDANADALYDDDGVHEAMVGNTGVHPLGERAVVVYMALELTDAHTGPRMAVRTADDFHARVHLGQPERFTEGTVCDGRMLEQSAEYRRAQQPSRRPALHLRRSDVGGLMMLLHAGRASGKTTQAMAWLSHGVRVPFSYPGWTRVLVVCHFAEFERLKKEYWSRLEDFDHRVYPIKEWLDAHNVKPSTEVCIDNFDMVIHGGWSYFPGWISAITITAEPWETQTFRESVSRVDG